jgi:hypothetical protein
MDTRYSLLSRALGAGSLVGVGLFLLPRLPEGFA